MVLSNKSCVVSKHSKATSNTKIPSDRNKIGDKGEHYEESIIQHGAKLTSTYHLYVEKYLGLFDLLRQYLIYYPSHFEGEAELREERFGAFRTGFIDDWIQTILDPKR